MESLSIFRGMQRIFRSQNIGVIQGYEDKYSKSLGLESALIVGIANGGHYELTTQNIRRIAWVLDVRMHHIMLAVEDDIRRGVARISDLSEGDTCWKIFRPERVVVEVPVIGDLDNRRFNTSPAEEEIPDMELRSIIKEMKLETLEAGGDDTDDDRKTEEDAWDRLARYWDVERPVRRIREELL